MFGLASFWAQFQ